MAQGVWGRKLLVGSRGEAPVADLGDEEAESVCRQCLQILTAETIKMCIFSHNEALQWLVGWVGV